MARKITLYTNNNEQSNLARKYLLENHVIFEEINVTKGKEKPIIIKAERIPLLIVKGSHGISTVSGFDEFKYASAMNPSLSHDEWIRMKNDK